MNVSYDLTESLVVSFEGINVTGENIRQHNRNDRMVRYLDDLGPRYQIGVRYQF